MFSSSIQLFFFVMCHEFPRIPIAQAQEAYAVSLSELGLDGVPDDIIMQTMLANLYR